MKKLSARPSQPPSIVIHLSQTKKATYICINGRAVEQVDPTTEVLFLSAGKECCLNCPVLRLNNVNAATVGYLRRPTLSTPRVPIESVHEHLE